jgi:hypothetical protein
MSFDCASSARGEQTSGSANISDQQGVLCNLFIIDNRIAFTAPSPDGNLSPLKVTTN